MQDSGIHTGESAEAPPTSTLSEVTGRTMLGFRPESFSHTYLAKPGIED